MRVGQSRRPKPGERECGDRVLVVDSGGGDLLIAVIDGLGHGQKAARAADAAAEILAEHASLPLVGLVHHCDKELSSTRGVAMTLLRHDSAEHRLAHAAVGNVELMSAPKKRTRLVTEPGVVGGRVHRVRETYFSYDPGDLFVLVSDGVCSRIEIDPYRGRPPQEIADAIIGDHAKDHDDASCAVLVC